MRSQEEVARVVELAGSGVSHSEIARRTGISRWTIRQWLSGQTPNFTSRQCAVCVGQIERMPRVAYVYLLGLYLGDGCLSDMRRDVFKLRIVCTNCYPVLLKACADAMAAVIPTRVGYVRYSGHTEVYSYSKHWPCLFRSTGPGRSIFARSS